MSWLYWLFVLILLGGSQRRGLLAYRTYVMGDTSLNLKAAGCSSRGPSRAWA